MIYFVICFICLLAEEAIGMKPSVRCDFSSRSAIAPLCFLSSNVEVEGKRGGDSGRHLCVALAQQVVVAKPEDVVHDIVSQDAASTHKPLSRYVTQWPTSMWMRYNAFTNINGEWQHIIEPTPIWIPHLDQQDSLYNTIREEDILQPSEKSGFIKVKFSDVRNNGEDFLLIDTLIQVNPRLFK